MFSCRINRIFKLKSPLLTALFKHLWLKMSANRGVYFWGTCRNRRERVKFVLTGLANTGHDPVYGEHRRREIRPRSRFIEVPNCKTPATTGSYKHLCLETPASSRVLLFTQCAFDNRKDPAPHGTRLRTSSRHKHTTVGNFYAD